MSKEPSKRGGARPGTGPKPKHGVKQVSCSFYAPPAVIAALDERCQALDLTRGEFIAADTRLIPVEKLTTDVREELERWNEWLNRVKIGP